MNQFSDLDYWKDDIPDRWHSLLDTFVQLVMWSVKMNKMPDVQITDVRDKFGQLRIYYTGGDHRTDAYADFARVMSETLTGD